MTVGMKLTCVFLFLAALIGLSAYEGQSGIVGLGNVLDRVSGPAWDAANGTMELRIAVADESLLVEQAVSGTTTGGDSSGGIHRVAEESILSLDERIQGLLQSVSQTGFLPASELEEVETWIQDFKSRRDAYLQQDRSYDASATALRVRFSDFQIFMRRLLDYVQEEREKERSEESTSGEEDLGSLLGSLGNIGSQMATESALDTYISLLELNYRYQLLAAISGDSMGEERGAFEEELLKARKSLQTRTQNLSIQDIFDVAVSKPGEETWSRGVVVRSKNLLEALERASRDLLEVTKARNFYQEGVDKLNECLVRLEGLGDSIAEKEAGSIQEANESARRGIFVALLLGILAAMVAVFYVFTYIARPLRRVSLAMSAFAEGKSDVEIPERSGGKDEISELIGVLQILIDRLNGRRESFQRLSMEHASSVRETVATVRELRETAVVAQRIASDALSHADDGLVAGKEGAQANNLTREGLLKLARRVDGMSETISGLTEKIRQIGKIAGTVNDLSEQSKFLSLNAAIEAARAGEHGRGFGVVAVEVRMLAQQSQEASLEISRLITEISERAGHALSVAEEGRREARQGEEVLMQTEGAISKLSGALRSSHEASNKLLASSNQQAVGVDQIAQAMEEIDSAVEKILTAAEAR